MTQTVPRGYFPAGRTADEISAAQFRPAPRIGRERKIRRAAVAAGLLSVLGVVLLWAFGSGQFSALPGQRATALGRLAGLLAADLVLLQLITMARSPWLETAVGRDRLTRWHRWTGFSSINLLLLHIILITVGYATAGGVSVVAQSWDFVVNYPGILLAVGATLALLMVVATSVRIARRRLRYESWHLLHLYAYLGAGLALPHQLWSGQDFRSSPAATAFWWGLWAAAVSAVVGFRVLLPLWRSLRHRLVVRAVVAERPGVYSIVMSGKGLDRLGLRAGQFCQWRFLAGDGWSRAHPFTVSAPVTADTVRITVELVGDGSHAMALLRAGTRVLFEGPYGTMTADRRTHRDALLIAAGAGITPMRGLAEEICAEAPAGGVRRPSVVVLHRIRHASDALFVDEFHTLARSGRCKLWHLVGRRGAAGGWTPGGWDVAKLHEIVPDLTQRAVYVCGDEAWMRSVREFLLSVGLGSDQILCERFST